VRRDKLKKVFNVMPANAAIYQLKPKCQNLPLDATVMPAQAGISPSLTNTPSNASITTLNVMPAIRMYHEVKAGISPSLTNISSNVSLTTLKRHPESIRDAGFSQSLTITPSNASNRINKSSNGGVLP
jgi:hypothetical protein